MINNYKTIIHEDYLTYKVPCDWIIDDTNENGAIVIYNENGEGALTISFYTIIEDYSSPIQFIQEKLSRFAKNNNIILEPIQRVHMHKDGKYSAWGDGTDDENWHVRAWVVLKEHRFLVATYYYQKNTKDFDEATEIVESMSFE